jgi:pimeloyl-ACP methyl ester carboxylesterase
MSNKPVLFLLPGLMCDEAVWEHQAEVLSDVADIRIPVFRGFNSLVEMARSVLAQAPERFSVVGHSMGGRVAWEVMEMAGNRIDRFAVMDTGVHPVSTTEPSGRQALLDLARDAGLDAVAEAWIPPMIHPHRHGDKGLVSAIREMILRNSVEDFYGQMHALLNRKDQTASLPGIGQHVLLVAGEADGHSPPAQHEQMAALLPDSRLEVIAGAGHMVTMEKPDEVSEVLLSWFTGENT